MEINVSLFSNIHSKSISFLDMDIESLRQDVK